MKIKQAIIIEQDRNNEFELKLLDAMWEEAQKTYGIIMHHKDSDTELSKNSFIGIFMPAIQRVLYPNSD